MKILSLVKSLCRILLAKPSVPPGYEKNRLAATILNRRSVRRFQAKDLKDGEMDLILEAGRLTPSTVNMQTWSFGVYSETRWQEVFGSTIPFGGKRAVMVFGDTARIKSVADIFPDVPLVEYTVGVINASLASMNMTIMAEALGIGSVMLSDTGRSGFFSAAFLRKTLKLPPGVYPLMTIVFGYPRRGEHPMPPKFNVADICFQGPYCPTDKAKAREWFDLMEAGYKASHFFSSFRAKLKYYRDNLARAEGELQEMVFGESERSKVQSRRAEME